MTEHPRTAVRRVLSETIDRQLKDQAPHTHVAFSGELNGAPTSVWVHGRLDLLDLAECLVSDAWQGWLPPPRELPMIYQGAGGVVTFLSGAHREATQLGLEDVAGRLHLVLQLARALLENRVSRNQEQQMVQPGFQTILSAIRARLRAAEDQEDTDTAAKLQRLHDIAAHLLMGSHIDPAETLVTQVVQGLQYLEFANATEGVAIVNGSEVPAGENGLLMVVAQSPIRLEFRAPAVTAWVMNLTAEDLTVGKYLLGSGERASIQVDPAEDLVISEPPAEEAGPGLSLDQMAAAGAKLGEVAREASRLRLQPTDEDLASQAHAELNQGRRGPPNGWPPVTRVGADVQAIIDESGSVLGEAPGWADGPATDLVEPLKVGTEAGAFDISGAFITVGDGAPRSHGYAAVEPRQPVNEAVLQAAADRLVEGVQFNTLLPVAQVPTDLLLDLRRALGRGE